MSVTVFPAPSTGGAAKSPTDVIITSTQSWTAPAGVSSIELFLVGGGGGGAGAAGPGHTGGAGGGGGVLSTTLPVTPGSSYTVTIGAGGAVGTFSSSSPGGNGNSSTFGSLATSYGGGGGWSSNGGQFVTGIVSSGGGGGASTSIPSGSGGGAGPYHIYTPSNTFVGIQSNANALINVVQGTYGQMAQSNFYYNGNPGLNGYGAGGGGAQFGSGPAIQGGLNAGKGAQRSNPGTSGAANFGGGGGGSMEYLGAFIAGGSGGSGVAIIRYWS